MAGYIDENGFIRYKYNYNVIFVLPKRYLKAKLILREKIIFYPKRIIKRKVHGIKSLVVRIKRLGRYDF